MTVCKEDDALLDVTMAAASSVTANLEVVSNLWLEALLVRCDSTASWLSIEGGILRCFGQQHP